VTPDEQRRASAEVRRAILNGTATLEHIARGDYCEDDIFEASQEIARLREALREANRICDKVGCTAVVIRRDDGSRVCSAGHASRFVERQDADDPVCERPRCRHRRSQHTARSSVYSEHMRCGVFGCPCAAGRDSNGLWSSREEPRPGRPSVRIPEGLRAFVLTNRRAEPLLLLGTDGRAVHDVFTGSVVIAPGETLAYADGLESMAELQRVIVDSLSIGR
jgi:hypothetical protein